MKGLALSTVWALIIAIASVLLFLSLVTGTLRDAANWFYCDLYIKILNFFSGQKMASIPVTCRQFGTGQSKLERIDDTENDVFSRKLLAFIIACWKDAEIRENYETHPCYELRISGNVQNVYEQNVTDILIEEDHCQSIENSDYGCGANNQIIWNVYDDITNSHIINSQKILLIEYNGTMQAVEVLG